MTCPACGQDVRTMKLSGRAVFFPHFRPGAAPPCVGSNRTLLEAERAAAAERKGEPKAGLFD